MQGTRAPNAAGGVIDESVPTLEESADCDACMKQDEPYRQRQPLPGEIEIHESAAPAAATRNNKSASCAIPGNPIFDAAAGGFYATND